ncbi:hypothetical protein CK503_04845 [Aliifodinibius salipaludis]|uniref:Phosphoribosylpyrophosphate synthetase n=1 Tax=Fodinibius salipaludis TaxID=2032627 RepID=A0A2A2GCU0_9BACT|nr:hypothetical protein [Aliifodinibius salipaludis]PAU94804.1 hypothetical protein CK503_04845 [Aliifodinibius salipaludis]
MYKDLADAVESLKEQGYTNIFELEDDCITCKSLQKEFNPDELTIVESHPFDQGTDPGSESSVHAITTESGDKGFLVISYGMYVEPGKATIIDRLLNNSE